MSKVRGIIPCAGYGTRMGMEDHQSKEMLIDPITRDEMIQWSLDRCKENDIVPLVITRKEKVTLITYCEHRNIELLIIEPEGEWPNTILKSKDLWFDSNILFLPDTRFSPTSKLRIMKDYLDRVGYDYAIALHSVADMSKWCVVENDYIIEKPTVNGWGLGMGVIGWNKNTGQALFETLATRNKGFKLTEETMYCYLDKFVDITRTGLLETY